MKKKMRKFGDGGYTTVDPSNPVPSIDDDTRSRALKYVEGASEESRDIGAPVTRAATKSSSSVSQTVAPPKKPAAETPDEYKERMEGLSKKQALVNVHPEDYLPSGMLKPLLRKVVSMGAKTAENAVARNLTTKAGKEIPIKQGEMKTTPPVRAGEVRNKSGEKVKIKRGNDGMVDDGGSGAFKRGGVVRSSASRRADGCAIRGWTKA
jgi:hypothetical protein